MTAHPPSKPMDPPVPFRPHWWLRTGHAQTLWRKFSPIPTVVHERQRLELEDGDFIDLDWVDGGRAAAAEATDLVLILHGLCGSARSGYVQSLQAALSAQGRIAVAMNFRGCSGEFNRLARAYHSGVSEDLEAVVGALRTAYPNARLRLAGFSLGANVLLKWLGESSCAGDIAHAVAVSTPFDLAACSAAMGRGMGRLYGQYFLRRLVRDTQAKRAAFRAANQTAELARMEALGSLDGFNSLWAFDDRVTAPLHGFRNAEDYYFRASSRHALPLIRTPTLLLHSEDDPMIPRASLPGPDELSPMVRWARYPRGGHVGFSDRHDTAWLDRRIIEGLFPDS